MVDNPQSKIDQAVEMLEDDAFRRGGSIPLDTLLRIGERLQLDNDEMLQVRHRLREHEVVVHSAEGQDVQSEAPAIEAEPSDREMASVVQSYLRDAAEYDLLTKESEVATMRRIRAGEAAQGNLDSGCADPNGELASIVSDGQAARNAFITSNLRLVVYMAKQLNRGVHLQLEDLIQEGNLGLMKAIDKWDHKRGLRFSTYATWWIFQGITRAMANKNRLVRVPVHMQQRASKARQVRAALAKESAGKLPDLQTLSDHLGWSAQQVQFLLDMNREPVSLDAPVSEVGDATYGDSLPDEDMVSPEQYAVANELSRDVDEALSGLKDREAEILRRRFVGEETLEEIGVDFEVTRERIRQIEAKAIKRLQHPSRAKALAAHLDEDASNKEEPVE